MQKKNTKKHQLALRFSKIIIDEIIIGEIIIGEIIIDETQLKKHISSPKS
jgi:hypothetical protein